MERIQDNVAKEEWTTEDAFKASKEGWNLFNTDDGLQLQREDEMEFFPSDFEAWAFVYNQAKKGNKLSQKALNILVKENLAEVVVIVKNLGLEMPKILEIILK